ncbi:MAG TPA: S41 family peptidase [Bacilli bacterium]
MLTRIKKACAVAILAVLLQLSLMPLNVFGEQTEQAVNDQVYELLTQYHVSGVTESNFPESDVNTMLEKLNDPYTQYFSPDEWQSFANGLENQYVGIGVRLGEDNKGFYVIEVFPGSPAVSAGIQKGDYIAAVEGKKTAGQKLDDLVAAITGPEGTTVHITIERSGKLADYAITRKQITVPVLDAMLFPGGIGYIAVTDFSSDADEKFAAVLANWREKGMKSLVIDLRYNPGGLLDTAANMFKSFVPVGTLIQTKGRDGISSKLTVSGGQRIGVPVYILVNEYSASASEILTGALQDYKLAQVIGVQTFGKGSVQSIFPLADGGVLKITVEEYLTPHGRKVNGIGLKPDITVYSDTAQTITALRLAGLRDINLKLTDHETEINGKAFLERFPTIEANHSEYVPSRILAALVGADVAWDGKTKAVTLAENGTVRQFKLSDASLKLQDGVSFIDAQAFAAAYPEFAWSKQQNILQLSAREGK